MALPKLLQKLFQNGGAGNKLLPGIVPTTLNGNEPDANGNFTAEQTGCVPTTGGYAQYIQSGMVVFKGNPSALHFEVSQIGKDPSLDGVSGAYLALEELPNGWSAFITEKTKRAIRWPVGMVMPNNIDTVKEFIVSASSEGAPDGALMSLHASNCPDSAGSFGLFSRFADGSFGPSLFGRNDGYLGWNGQNVITDAGHVDNSWYKFSNGLKMCLLLAQIPANVRGVTVNYPIPFESVPYAFATVISNMGDVMCTTDTLGSTTSVFVSRTSHAGHIDFAVSTFVLAIGR